MQVVTDAARQFRHSTTLTREMVTTFLESVYLYDDHCEFQWKEQTVWEQLQGGQSIPITAPISIAEDDSTAHPGIETNQLPDERKEPS